MSRTVTINNSVIAIPGTYNIPDYKGFFDFLFSTALMRLGKTPTKRSHAWLAERLIPYVTGNVSDSQLWLIGQELAVELQPQLEADIKVGTEK